MVDIELPWTEKYRPRRIEGVVGQDHITSRLKAYAEKKEMPNLLFSGRAGIGKTASSLALAHELFGENKVANFLELNASDERGIDIVRGKIKDFAAMLPYGGANFKIIFLDEADALTPDAQNALRRTMEKYTGTCRFILSCNYSSKIIEPIQSRCAIFRFKPLSDDAIKAKLSEIGKQEGLEISEDAYKALIYVCEGDMRKAINVLQASATVKDRITEEVVYDIASRARPEEIKKMLDLSLKKEFKEARKMLDKLLYDYGITGDDLLSQLYKEVIDMEIEDKKKLVIIDKIGECNFRMVEGANERIQLESLLAQLMLLA